MNGKEFIKAVKNITAEKGISEDIVFDAMEQALITAYKKNFDSKTNVKVTINRETGDIKVYSYLVVVDDYIEGDEIVDEEGNITYTEPEINEDAQILLEDAQKLFRELKLVKLLKKKLLHMILGELQLQLLNKS